MKILSNSRSFSWNESSFFVNDTAKRFVFSKSQIISLSARVKDSLQWDLTEAEKLRGKEILWSLDLGLFQSGFDIDEMSHKCRILAVTNFMKAIYPQFMNETYGVILYQGPLDITPYSPQNSLSEALDFLSYHVTLFAHVLSDEIPIYLLFDVSKHSKTDCIHALAPSRFAHYVLGLKGTSLPFAAFGWDSEGKYGVIGDGSLANSLNVRLGVLVPQKQNIDAALEEIDEPYRLLYEDFAHTSWDGLDAIIAFSDTMDTKAKRVLQGFIAAGGLAVIRGKPIGLAEEISWESYRENRGRGIRTPGLLVPNQTR